MKNFIKILKKTKFGLLCIVLVMSSCKKDDSSQVTLDAFGPCPVLRGAKISIIGQNLDKVTAVLLPGCDEISGAGIERISKEEIKIVVPQTAVEGKISIRHPKGTIESVASLSFTEPYIITSITPLEPIRAGVEVTISGDYLNNITEVVFTGEADNVVDTADFVSQSREEIKVNVPLGAMSGKIIVKDVYGNELYSDEMLTIIQPTLAGLSPLNIKAGESISVTGTDLDLIKNVRFAGGAVADAFSAQDETHLVLAVPADAQDGIITLVAYSLVEIQSADAIELVVPSSLVANPSTGIWADDEITITGVDLDLVTDAKFEGVADAVEVTDQSATSLKVTVPTGTKSGDIVLNLGSGKTVSVAIETKKPVFTSFSTNPAVAKNELTINGTNMDLVVSVVLGGDITIKNTENIPDALIITPTSLTFTVPMAAETGNVTLNMLNGESVEISEELTIDKPLFCFITEPPTDIYEPGTMLVVTVENGDKLSGVLWNGDATQYILSGNTLYILIPSGANPSSTLTLVSSNGSVDYPINVVNTGIIETIIFEGPIELDWGNPEGRLYKPSFVDVPAGSMMKLYYTPTGVDPQIQLNDANWTKLALNDPNFSGESLSLPADGSTYEVELTQSILNTILTVEDGWSETAIVFKGQQVIISKISIIVVVPTGGTDPVDDPNYVFFDFKDGSKNSWWGQASVNTPLSNDFWVYEGVENDPSLSLDGSPYFRGNNGTGMFFRNGADNMTLDGVTLEDWLVKFDVRVISGEGAIRLELASGGVQYMAVVQIAENHSWHTISVPFSQFLDGSGSGTNPLPDLNIDEFGATDGGNGNTMELLIDNVRYEHK